MNLVQVYLHNDLTHDELEESYTLSKEEADTTYNVLYEVDLILDLDTKKIIAVGGMKVSDEAIGSILEKELDSDGSE